MQQVPSDRYWAKVLFKEFIRHYRRMTDEQAAADVKQSMLDLEDLNPDGESFGSKMVRWSIERKDSKTAVASRENGKKGGRPRKNECSSSRQPNATEDAATREGAVNMTSAPSGQTRCWTLESGTSSVAKFNDQETIEISTNNKKGTGTGPVREKKVPVPDVLSLAYSGEFGNVRLTQEQYAELGIKFGNLQKLNRAIDSLSCKLENNEITPPPKNHYAVLVKWASYRDDMEEMKQQEAETPKMTEMEKSWFRSSAMIAQQEKELTNERR